MHFRQTCSGFHRSVLYLRYVEIGCGYRNSRSQNYLESGFFSTTTSMVATSLWKMSPHLTSSGSLWTCRTNAFCTIGCASHGTCPALNRVLLSGILARAHTIKKCSFPEAQMRMVLRCLCELANEQRLPAHTFAFQSKLWHKT